MLLQGVTPERPESRLVDASEDDLRLLRTSEELPEEWLDADADAQHAVSSDLRWWSAVAFEPTVARLAAGRLGDPEPAFRWTLDVAPVDPFLAALVTFDPSAADVTLALALDGEAWLL